VAGSGLQLLAGVSIPVILTVIWVQYGTVVGAVLVAATLSLLLVGWRFGGNKQSEATRAVLDALTYAPQRIVRIRQYRWTRGLRPRASLTVSTDEHSLYLTVGRSIDIIGMLARRCPGAKLEGD
jgi:hypothetical protein